MLHSFDKLVDQDRPGPIERSGSINWKVDPRREGADCDVETGAKSRAAIALTMLTPIPAATSVKANSATGVKMRILWTIPAFSKTVSVPYVERSARLLTAHGRALERVDMPLPEPQGREVLLRASACSIFHADLHLWDGCGIALRSSA